jgi:hypothetical protein
VNLCRLPLSWAFGGIPVVSGDRDSHDGRIKPSQTPEIIDALASVFAHAGVSLLEPLRAASTERVEELVGTSWPEGLGQLVCDLGDSPRVRQAKACYDPDEQAQLAREFVIPVGREVVDAWRLDADPDYEQIVERVIDLLPDERAAREGVPLSVRDACTLEDAGVDGISELLGGD